MTEQAPNPPSNSLAAPAAKLSVVTLVVLAIGQFLVGLDMSVATVALPSIGREFGVGLAPLQWTVMAYMIAGAALSVPIGALGDTLGRRKIYLIGLFLFGAGSLVSAMANGTGMLIAGRAIAGAGSAAMGTLALAMLTASVAHDMVTKIVGLWTAVATASSALGPLIGGLLVTAFGWRSVFAINIVPIAGLILFVIFRLRSTQVPRGGAIDWLGAGLLTSALIMVCAGLSQAESVSWGNPQVWGPIAIGLVIIGVMAVQQKRSKHPMVPWGLLKAAPIPATIVLLIVLGMTLSGSMMQQTLLQQNILGFSPALAGVVGLGASVFFVICSPLSPFIAERIGLRVVSLIGLLLAAVGTLLLSGVKPDSSAWYIAVAFGIMGIGLGLSMPAVSGAAMASTPKDDMGSVSGVIGLAGQVASVLGIAVVGGIAAARTLAAWAHLVPVSDQTDAVNTLVTAGNVGEVGHQVGAAAQAAASAAFVQGVSETFLIATAGLAIAAIASFFLMPKKGAAQPKASAQPATT